jgi:L-aminopeptidase/D-esterase-like protein
MPPAVTLTAAWPTTHGPPMTDLNLITDIPGIRVGHAHDSHVVSGVTAVLFDRGAVAAVAIHGGAPGVRDTALLAADMTVSRIDAIVLSGGSAFGLDAAGGVQAVLAERGVGLRVRDAVVPIVPQAIVFDLLNGGNKRWGRRPLYFELGCAAADAAAAGRFPLGSVGAGTGATTVDCKGGVGSASTRTTSGHRVGALVVVNALGTAIAGPTGEFWAGLYEVGDEFGGLGLPAGGLQTAIRFKGAGPATTIACVATDAALTKAEAHRVAVMAHDGMARALRPAHAPMDGDTVFAAATGDVPLTNGLGDLTLIGSAAADCLARAIARAVYEATDPGPPYAGPPAWRDIYGS